ncbi:MAG: aspartyl protease family protein [Flavobacteriaceae bacterium]|nr:aspartyl protease family protein [Flavobacteriaceae bacterium]
MTVRFKLINNLIVLPLEVNGKPLSFILDTGVGKTLLFNLSENDSIDLKDVNKITLKGLGDGEPLEALLSRNNTIKIKNYISNKENIYVILKDKFDVSGKMGVTVHGIIGYKILRDVIVYINYKTKRITFYNPKFFKYKKCRRCEVFPLQFYGNKPYINAQVQLDTVGNKQTDVKLLIDSGGSSAIWLFEDTNEEIKTPKKYFKAILGEGLSGTIHGNNSRIKSLTLGRYKIKNPTVSFLDSASTYYARQFKERNGSIGGNILKRFKVWLDYPNGKITLRKNGSFRGGFEYNMSGIDVVYNGKVLVKEKEVKSSGVGQYNLNPESNDINTISLYVNYRYRFKPSYKIKYILPDSPADKAGLKAGDVIISINGVKVHKYSLKELLSKFQSGHRRKIRMKIERKDVQMKFEFRLKKRV